MRVSLLDFCSLDGLSRDEALRAIVRNAMAADHLGFSRYWLAEHWTPSTVSPCPEILVPVLAGLTDYIRVGVAGVLVNYYDPIKVRATASTLELLFPDRIDLGLAAGRVSPALQAHFIHATSEISYGQRVKAIHELKDCQGLPWLSMPSEVWVLGGGSRGVELAVQMNANYCHSLFHGKKPIEDRVVEAKEACAVFRGAATGRRLSIAISSVCTPTTKRDLVELAWAQMPLTLNCVGDAADIRRTAARLAGELQADEIVLYEASPAEGRAQVLEQLASEFALARPTPSRSESLTYA